jgi:6-phosphogluconolactonase (cycloisomerase 2 family)
MRPTAPTDPGVQEIDRRGNQMSRTTTIIRRVSLALALAIVPLAGAVAPASADTPAGHVYVQTNALAGNQVRSFARSANGSLALEETVGTGGTGTSAGLGSQAPLAISGDGEHLLVVNAGSDDVSLFAVRDDGLELLDVTGVGDLPVSVAVHGSIAYVLNQGSDSIQGLRIDDDELVRIPHSSAPLSGIGVAAAQVAFRADGRILAVTEKATNRIDTYVMRPNGRAVGPNVHASAGAVPFGFAFGSDGRLYVSEAPGSAASSYAVGNDGALGVISASVPNGQIAACWLAVTSDARFAYTANAGSANVSGYTIGTGGTLALIGTGATGATDPGPVDLDVSDGDGFVYVLNSRSGSISGFAIDPANGALSPVTGAAGFAVGAAGLVAV